MEPTVKLVLLAAVALIAIYITFRALEGILFLVLYVLALIIAALPLVLLLTGVILASVYEQESYNFLIIVISFIASSGFFLIVLKSKTLKKLLLRINPPPPPTQSYKIDLSSIAPPPLKKPK